MVEIPLIAGYSDTTVQWRAKKLQMVNWGGFHGYHHVDFGPASTLISGASGTGKSTLLDAYTAIMMPTKMPFNGASNDTARGRARGAEQRNVLTYLRGKRDTSRDGELVTDHVLRGDGEDAWGLLSMTFVNDLGRHFTALRTFYAPAAARTGADVAMRMFTSDGELDLRDLASLADARFDLRAIRSRFPAFTHHDGVTKFLEFTTNRLGIGANGNGEKALMLLARIQAGHQVRTVDRLYKDLVLEEPTTFKSAENAVAHFRSLNQSFEELETSGEKEKRLRGISRIHDSYETARARAERLDRFGVSREPGTTIFDLWRLQTLARLLDEAEQANRLAYDTVSENHAEAVALVGRLKAELGSIEDQQRANGGGALEQIAGRLDDARETRRKVERARVQFAIRTEALYLDIADKRTFIKVQDAARDFLGAFDTERQFLQDARDAVLVKLSGLEKEFMQLDEERASLHNREGRVPLQYDVVRRQIAQACGLRPDELPFAAELMDVFPGHSEWRLAAELTLRGVGLTLLMDERQQRHIRETIEPLALSPRVNFEGVRLGQRSADPSDDRFISGRLIFKESPFTGWVKNRVQYNNIDHLCVDHPSALGGDSPKVTIHGQVSRGRHGAHGRNKNQQFILGFSNESRLQEIDRDTQLLSRQLDSLRAQRTDLDDKLSTLGRRKEAYQAILDADWTSLDIDAADAELTRLEQDRERLLAKSDVLAGLQRQHDETEARYDSASRRRFALENARDELRGDWERIIDQQNQTSSKIKEIESSGFRSLEEDDTTHLNEQFAVNQGGMTYGAFDDAVRRFRHTLASECDDQRSKARGYADQLHTIFNAYNERWPDPNRGDTVESYPEFASIYEEIVKHGLFKRREVWKRNLQAWSGKDLKMLNDAFDVALSEIEERLDPVNEILRTLPFGAERDRLRIDLRQVESHRVSTFRQRLRTLASNTTLDWSADHAEDRFRHLRSFMAQLEKSKESSTAERDDLLDVRRHIEITATRVNGEGRELSTYSALGGKSGGESQELVAFIVGAALRYQLGDETRTMPRFAPVLLDEGFVKADGEFAKRAVDAWLGLGFQLIIGAPLDKVTALEPHMELVLGVTKNPQHGYSYVAAFRDAPVLSGASA